jgi:hypothetical protein
MKVASIIMIMSSSFLIGNNVKKKVKNEYKFLLYLKNFVIYLRSNFNMFKSNLVTILNEYIALQENNNDFNLIFDKRDEIYIINKEAIYSNISKEEDALTIYTFLSSLGQNNYEFEDEKINSFLAFLEVKIAEYFTNIKVKGVLTEKIMLAVGLIISILVW